jgi:hypothetical protein
VPLGCVLLIVASAGLEITGLGLLAMDLWRVQRRRLGTPRWMQRLRARWRRLLGRQQTVTGAAASVLATVHGSARARVRRGPGETLETRIAVLEANLDELDRDTSARFTDMEQRLTAAHQRVDEIRGYVDQLRRDQEEAEREELQRSIPWQWVGTGLFALGALLGMWANLAC